MSRHCWTGWGNDMTRMILFDPLIPWAVIAGLTGLITLVLAVAFLRGLSGWALRGMGVVILLMVLANPSLQQEEREPLDDIVLLVVDRTASQAIGGRDTQIEEAIHHIRSAVDGREHTELREISVLDSADDQGTLAMSAIAEALVNIPLDRLAGVLMISDGQVHDLGRLPDVPSPVHLVLTGKTTDRDRRLSVLNLPPFAILGEDVNLTVQIDDLGEAVDPNRLAEVSISVDAEPTQRFQIPVGQPIDLTLQLPHGGMNTLHLSTPEVEGELTARNNSAIARINGVRDRLRVLLVSGAPHPGERTWRNLLKSDSAVDLVHFTILRPPEKSDGVPVNELSLIAFPTRELFLEKIDEFDLIIFDRYKRRGILPSIYLSNVRNYVEQGGAVLFAAGPDFATAESLYHSDLANVIPARPTARLLEQGFAPKVSTLGARHPVTADLEDYAPSVSPDSEDAPQWGRWLRQIELQANPEAQTVMTGVDGVPLLVLDRVGSGRVALLASDQSWLWSRGFDGGGPQLELFRRLAHWMMKEPELEEEALWAESSGQSMTIVRRTLSENVEGVVVESPEGNEQTLTFDEVSPGRFEAQYEGREIGLYRLSSGDMRAVTALGTASPREFKSTIADGSVLAPFVESLNGGIVQVEDGLPRLRNVRAGRSAAGRGWLGLVPRQAYVTSSVSIWPVLPAWIYLVLASGLFVLGWLREGRR